jgi:hypothetical protein
MVYTIKIEDKTPKAKSIINFLKFLKEDYDFIEINDEDSNSLEANIDKELTRRYQMFVEDSTGKDWEVLKKELH